MRSASTRCAPKVTNISPTTDLPEAMPPVSPTFSTKPPNEERSPHRHRDTEESKERKRKVFSVSLCLCGESSSFGGQFGHTAASPHLRGLHRVVHQHRDGQRADAAGNRGQRSGDFGD